MGRRSLAVAVLLLASCNSLMPDVVRVGVGHRDEEFSSATRTDDYGGRTFWVEADYILKPRQQVIDFSPQAQLWISELMHHLPTVGGQPIVIDHRDEGPPAPKKTETEALIEGGTKLLQAAKGESGNYTVEGILALLLVCALIVLVLLLRRKQNSA